MNPTEEHTYRDGILRRLDDLKVAVEKVDTKVSYTNGKVKRIVVALVLIAGVIVGQNFSSIADIIRFVAGVV